MDEAANEVMAVSLVALGTGLAFIAGCAIYYGREIRSSRIPVLWSTAGEPTWHAPRLAGLWFVFGVTALLSALLLVLVHYRPEWLLPLILTTAAVISAGMWFQMVHLRRVARWQLEAPSGNVQMHLLRAAQDFPSHLHPL